MPRSYQRGRGGGGGANNAPQFVDPAIQSIQAAAPAQQPMPQPQYAAQPNYAAHGIRPVQQGVPAPRYQQATPMYQQPVQQGYVAYAAVPQPRSVAPAAPAAPAAAAPQKYACTGCGKQYPNVDVLASHMESANHGTWFECKAPNCGWAFVTQQCLATHINNYHPNQQRQQQQQQQHQQQYQQQQQQQYREQQQFLQQFQRGHQQQHQQYQQPQRGRGGGAANFAQMAARAAANPAPMQHAQQRNYGQTVQKAKLNEGETLTGDSKKTYDAIVKQFIEDDSRGELQFPPTLTAQERHHVHKLCMHYQLDHQSTGAGANRQLRIWKPTWVAPDGEDEEGGTGSNFDGFRGCQPLNDEYVDDHVAEIAALVRGPSQRMQETMEATLAHAAAAEAKRQRRRERGGSSGSWFGGNPPPVDAALRQKGEALQAFRHKLPSYKMKDGIIDAVRKNQVTVLCGDTGCGKTTQIPQLLHDAGIGKDFPGGGMILCTQPRRVSAISVAQRVADERGERCGGSVGYSIRFENIVSSQTRILYMTTGILLRRLHNDPTLSGVAAVVVDEVHERDVDTDFALLLLRDLVRSRKSKLRLIVMSATIQVEKLVKYFSEPSRPPPPLISVPGALFDVKEYWLDDALQWLGADPASVPAMAAAIEAAKNSAKAATAAVEGQRSSYDNLKEAALARLDKAATENTVPIEVICGIIEMYHRQAPRHHAVLVFLPGWAAIDKTMTNLRQKSGGLAKELSILPLHSTLTTAEQQRVFQPAPKNHRKVVLATNIAETSITIDDIVLVIDSCLHKGTSYDAVGNTSSLTSQLIAKANGKQRRGRAGRVQAGVCVHLLPKASYDALPDFLPPEMQRTALEEICLQVKAIVDEESCIEVLGKALDAPPAASIGHAVEHLRAIGALDSKERLTALGRVLATMPLHPTLGKMLLLGAALGVFDPLCTLAAALSGKGPFLRPLPHQVNEARAAVRQFDKDKRSDHFAMLELYRQWSAAPRRSDFAYSHWADHMALVHMERMRSQLRRLITQSGFLKHAPQGWESRYATNDALVRFALAHSLTPRIAVMERDLKNRHNNLFCWDNKPATLHPGSLLARVKLRDIQGTEFFVYFDRMRLESQLAIFDASAISRTTMVLAAKTLDMHETASLPEKERFDERKFRAWDSPERDPAKEALTLVLDDGKKRFTVPQAHGDALLAVHDTVNFTFALAMQRMDVRAVDDDVVCALAAALGQPARRIDPKELEDAQAAAAADVRLGPSQAAMVPNAAESDSDDGPEFAPEVDNGTEDDEDDADGAAVAGTHVKLTAAEADVLVRAYGDLSWISRRTLETSETETSAPSAMSPLTTSPAPTSAAVSPALPEATAAAEDVQAPALASPAAVSTPTSLPPDPAIIGGAVAATAAAAPPAAVGGNDDDDDDDDEEGDEVVVDPQAWAL